jgi:hypothetical protein
MCAGWAGRRRKRDHRSSSFVDEDTLMTKSALTLAINEKLNRKIMFLSYGQIRQPDVPSVDLPPSVG